MENTEQIKETLIDLLNRFDPTYNFSDDHKYWKHHCSIHDAISHSLHSLSYEEALDILKQYLKWDKWDFSKEQHQEKRRLIIRLFD